MRHMSEPRRPYKLPLNFIQGFHRLKPSAATTVSSD